MKSIWEWRWREWRWWWWKKRTEDKYVRIDPNRWVDTVNSTVHWQWLRNTSSGISVIFFWFVVILPIIAVRTMWRWTITRHYVKRRAAHKKAKQRHSNWMKTDNGQTIKLKECVWWTSVKCCRQRLSKIVHGSSALPTKETSESKSRHKKYCEAVMRWYAFSLHHILSLIWREALSRLACMLSHSKFSAVRRFRKLKLND